MAKTENSNSVEEPEAPAISEEKPEAETPQPTSLNPQTPKPKTSLKQKLSNFKSWFAGNKKKSIPLSILAVLLLITLIPQTRYILPGLFMTRDVSIQVENSNFDSAVSDAEVTMAGKTAKTNGKGVAKLQDVPLGNYKLVVTKKYYKTVEDNLTVGFGSQQSASLEMESEGALVELTVKNKISGESVESVEVKSGESVAKTDEEGKTVLVLPFGTKEAEVVLSQAGYVTTKSKVSVSDNEIKKQSLTIPPEGNIYFLSKASGKIDVVKTNLDGTDRKVVLAGTGKEDEYDTVLLASTDWKYLALKSKRDGGENSKIFLIDTKDDSVANVDEGEAYFDLAGWSGHNFVYSIERFKKQEYEDKKYAIKSYNADNKELKTIYETKTTPFTVTVCEGGDECKATGHIFEQFESNYAYGSRAIYLSGEDVIFSKKLIDSVNYYNSSYYDFSTQLTGKKAGLYKVNKNGGSITALKEISYYDPPNQSRLDSYNYGVEEIYIRLFEGDSGYKYFEYENGQINNWENGKDEFGDFKDLITYLQSPSKDETFWSEDRDGKTVVFVGDEKGENGKQIARLSEYLQYGWYTNDYLLFSKNGSELYIMAKSELEEGREPVKISDYHKPSYSYYGYGGGYGGY